MALQMSSVAIAMWHGASNLLLTRSSSNCACHANKNCKVRFFTEGSRYAKAVRSLSQSFKTSVRRVELRCHSLAGNGKTKSVEL